MGGATGERSVSELHGVIGMRFDVETQSGPDRYSEICAYGTAVIVEPLSPDPLDSH
jgi:hypothetical protein